MHLSFHLLENGSHMTSRFYQAPRDSLVNSAASPSPSSSSGSVEVTGVLAVTAFSATMDFDPEWTLSKVANNLRTHLSDGAQKLFELDSPVGLCGLDIFKSASVQQPGGLKKPITEAKADEEEAKYLIMFDLPPEHVNILETYIKKNKENLAIAHGDSLVKEEAELKGKKGKGKGKKKGKAVQSSTSSQISNVSNSTSDDTLAAISRRLDIMQTSNEKLNETIVMLNSKVGELTSSNGELISKVNELTSSNRELTSSNANLLEKVRNLAASNDDMTSQLQSHSKRLGALNRRLVLDDARNKLTKDYNLSPEEFRPRSSNVNPLVQQIQSKLNTEDAKLLSHDALIMIFDSSDDSMRDVGNKAAYESSHEDRVHSVLEARLTKTQRTLLTKIYIFIHGVEPDFERST